MMLSYFLSYFFSEVGLICSYFLPFSSSRGGLEVELWTDNSLPSALVDQIPLWQCIYMVPYGPPIYAKSTDVCYMCV